MIIFNLLGRYDLLSLLIMRDEVLFILSCVPRGAGRMRRAPGETIVMRNGLSVIALS